MKTDNLPISVKGHLKIVDDLGNVLVDKDNAVHPQNLARVFARALANESNYFIHRIAFGNGGTVVDSAYTVTYKTPNDGQPPDPRTWDSRLYRETYSEVVDEGNITLNPLLGTDPGSAGPNTGTRGGGGASPAGDPTSVPHVSGPGVHSNELGLTSEVVITVVLNPDEPKGQFQNDNLAPSEGTEGWFTFDEIGLYTSGAPAIDTNGYQDVDVGNRTSTDDTGLLAGTQYSFEISVDGGAPVTIDFTTPATGGTGPGGEITYGDLCEAINTGDTNWNPTWGGVSPLPGGATVSITDISSGLTYPSIAGAQTYGYLRFTSSSTGVGSSISLAPGTVGLDLFASLNPPGGGTILAAVDGKDAGIQNDPVNPDRERERLLTHVIFSPVLKAANRSLVITYTLTISVARTT